MKKKILMYYICNLVNNALFYIILSYHIFSNLNEIGEEGKESAEEEKKKKKE